MKVQVGERGSEGITEQMSFMPSPEGLGVCWQGEGVGCVGGFRQLGSGSHGRKECRSLGHRCPIRISPSRVLHISSTHGKLLLPWCPKMDMASSTSTLHPRPLVLTASSLLVYLSGLSQIPAPARKVRENTQQTRAVSLKFLIQGCGQESLSSPRGTEAHFTLDSFLQKSSSPQFPTSAFLLVHPGRGCWTEGHRTVFTWSLCRAGFLVRNIKDLSQLKPRLRACHCDVV